MRKIIKRLVGNLLGGKIITSIFRLINKRKLHVLFYHRISTGSKRDSGNYNLCVDLKSFESQMQHIRHYFRPVSEAEIIASIDTKKQLPANAIWVTFDDGYKDNFIYAYPLLKKMKIPATFFVTTGYVNKQIVPPDDSRLNGSNADLFMEWDEMKELVNNGFNIGAHTVTHKVLSTLNKDQLKEEISRSKEEIEQKLGITVYSFAYPKGKTADYVLKDCVPVLNNCNFRLAVSTLKGCNDILHMVNNRFNIGRFGVSYNDNFNFFKFKVAAGSFWKK